MFCTLDYLVVVTISHSLATHWWWWWWWWWSIAFYPKWPWTFNSICLMMMMMMIMIMMMAFYCGFVGLVDCCWWSFYFIYMKWVRNKNKKFDHNLTHTSIIHCFGFVLFGALLDLSKRNDDAGYNRNFSHFFPTCNVFFCCCCLADDLCLSMEINLLNYYSWWWWLFRSSYFLPWIITSTTTTTTTKT